MKTSAPPQWSAFSLIEVTLALAIAALAIVSILGILPSALKNSADSADQTAIGTMFEDIEDRVKNNPLEPGPIAQSPFFYDIRGSYVDPDFAATESTIVTEPFYRAEVTLIEPTPLTGSSLSYEDALAVQVKIFWPIDAQGAAIHPQKPGSEHTYLAGAQTGPGWLDVDPDYRPKIEY